MNGHNQTDESGSVSKARERVAAELAELRQRRERMANDLSRLDNVGDRGDDADELGQADALAALDNRITELSTWLAGGDAMNADGTLPDGTTATLRFGDSDPERIRIVAIADEVSDDDATTVTAHSPLGRALVGRQSGDVVTFETPQGPRQAEILALNLPED
ncbi:GreA/GreB family elongation factor [Skermania sp. ID1734]|uniref:GreA/GreB family elongation factor n=1 Tax=Skermania sp. ID1734 TaxID=2597516 RepID=UPI00163D8097|nr:GreA/GreB family elongation factor [Skermania sp. ID1734]